MSPTEKFTGRMWGIEEGGSPSGGTISEGGKGNRKGRRCGGQGKKAGVSGKGEGGQERMGAKKEPPTHGYPHTSEGLIAIRQEGACTLIDATESLVTTPAGKAPGLDSLKIDIPSCYQATCYQAHVPGASTYGRRRSTQKVGKSPL